MMPGTFVFRVNAPGGLAGGKDLKVPIDALIEAAEGIDWGWEHRIEDLQVLGL